MIVISVVFHVVFLLLFGAIAIDVGLAVNDKDPYFFDPDYIEAYDEPMLDEIYPEILSNYHQYSEEIHTVEKSLGFLPDNDELRIEIIRDSMVNLRASYGGGYHFESPFEYYNPENRELLRKLAIRPATIDKLKKQSKSANCISFEKSDALRLGFRKGKSGTFYYRFESSTSPAYQALLDSCLITRINDQVLIEYVGSGRGPDCIVSRNPEGYDDRGFFEKWKDLIKTDHKKVHEDIFEEPSQREEQK